MKPRMTIGKLAESAGVGVETIRFYQRSGLLQEPDRPLSGFREYTVEDARHICFIKRAQMLGFRKILQRFSISPSPRRTIHRIWLL